MRQVFAVYKRELLGYFITPVAYVFIALFLLTNGAFTFYFSSLYEAGQANLNAFFMWHPWMAYLLFMPAIAMRLWSEERKLGTLELLATLPVPLWQIVLAKFLAAWKFAGISLALTTPVWLTVTILGDPDHGIIIASYLASLLMAGSYLAIGSFMSCLTRNQIVAFIGSVAVCFAFLIIGFPMIINILQAFLPAVLVETIASFSFLTNFQQIAKGVLGCIT